jgi:hypothetical protein
VISVTDPYGRNLGFLDRSRYSFFQVARQLSGPRCRTTTSQKNVVVPGIETGPLDL